MTSVLHDTIDVGGVVCNVFKTTYTPYRYQFRSLDGKPLFGEFAKYNMQVVNSETFVIGRRSEDSEGLYEDAAKMYASDGNIVYGTNVWEFRPSICTFKRPMNDLSCPEYLARDTFDHVNWFDRDGNEYNGLTLYMVGNKLKLYKEYALVPDLDNMLYSFKEAYDNDPTLGADEIYLKLRNTLDTLITSGSEVGRRDRIRSAMRHMSKYLRQQHLLG
jgi:hypothetical protein